jgi:hypothetical protein
MDNSVPISRWIATMALGGLRISVLSPIHLPTSLCSTPVTALPSSYGGSDSRPPFTRAEGYPRFTTPEFVLSFCAQPPRGFLCPRVTLVVSAFQGRPMSPALPARIPSAFSASPFERRLAKTQGRIDFLIVRTDRLAYFTVALHPAFRRRSYLWLSTGRVFG